MTYTRTALAALLCLWISPFLAQTGPAGVRNNTSNRIWYKPEQLSIFSAGAALSSWGNQGGNGPLNAFESGNRRPTIVANSAGNFNGFRSLRFDGHNDVLRINNSADVNTHSGQLSQKSYALVFKTGSDINSRQVIYEEGGTVRGVNVFIQNGQLYFGAYNLPNDGAGAPWPFQSLSISIQPNTEYIFTGLMNGNSSETGLMASWLNGASMGELYTTGLLYAHGGAIALGAVRGDSYFFNSGAGGNHSYFEGEIAEFIYYREAINDCERVIIENYLSSKFNIALNSLDIFSLDDDLNGNYDFELAGIGQNPSGLEQTDAQGRGILRFNNADNLNASEYFIWAHNNAPLIWENASSLSIIDEQLQRSWKIDQSGDVGVVDLIIDLDDLNISAANDFRILLDENNNGVYEDEEVILAGPEYLSTSSIRFSALDLTPGVPFTLGYSFLLLPVLWSDFQVESNITHVKINWTTASEMNNSLFMVERSANAEDWTTISYVDGAGNSDTPISYNVNDMSPLSGTSYYRVRQMDYSGMSNTTEIKVVERIISDNDFELSLFPNPSTDYITIDSPEPIKGEVVLMSMTGQTIQKAKFDDNDRVHLSLRDLPRGTYFAQVISSLGTRTMEVIKE